MKIHYLGTIAANSAAGTASPVYSIQLNENDNYNRNNIGVFNVSGTASGTFTVQGSATGTAANNHEWVDLATGVTTAAGTATVGGSGAKTIALMPFMRFVVTTLSTSAVTGYISQ